MLTHETHHATGRPSSEIVIHPVSLGLAVPAIIHLMAMLCIQPVDLGVLKL